MVAKQVFIGGSIHIKEERNAVKNAILHLNNEVSDTYILYVKTFEDFPKILQDEGHQPLYNKYIAEQADYVIFVFRKGIGIESQKELKIALNSMNVNQRPRILVFYKEGEGDDESVKSMKILLTENNQYSARYSSLDHLEMMVVDELKKDLQKKSKIRSNTVEILKGIGLILSLFFILISIFFSIGYGVAKYSETVNVEKVFVENISTNYRERCIEFSYNGFKTNYYLINDSIGDVIYPDDYYESKRDVSINPQTFFTAISFGATMSVLNKNISNLQYLKNSGKGGKLLFVGGVCLIFIGTICGYTQGYSVGKESALMIFKNELPLFLKDQNSWTKIATKAKSNILWVE